MFHRRSSNPFGSGLEIDEIDQHRSTNPFDDESDNDESPSEPSFSVGSDQSESISMRTRRIRRVVSAALQMDDLEPVQVVPTTPPCTLTPPPPPTSPSSPVLQKSDGFPFLTDLLKSVNEISEARVSARTTSSASTSSQSMPQRSTNPNRFQTALENFVLDDSISSPTPIQTTPLTILSSLHSSTNEIPSLQTLQKAVLAATTLQSKLASQNMLVHEETANTSDHVRMLLANGYLKGYENIKSRLTTIETRYKSIIDSSGYQSAADSNPNPDIKTTTTTTPQNQIESISKIQEYDKIRSRLNEASEVLSIWWKMEDLAKFVSSNESLKNSIHKDILAGTSKFAISTKTSQSYVEDIFVDPERSFEAAIVLKHLRLVARSGSNSSDFNSDGGRFNKTGVIIQLISDAGE